MDEDEDEISTIAVHIFNNMKIWLKARNKLAKS
jgi:hypothetical protein